MGQTTTNTTATNRTRYGGFFNARKQSGGTTVAIDITNHLIPWAVAKQLRDEAYRAGIAEGVKRAKEARDVKPARSQ